MFCMPSKVHCHRIEFQCGVRYSSSSKARHPKNPVDIGTLHELSNRIEHVKRWPTSRVLSRRGCPREFKDAKFTGSSGILSCRAASNDVWASKLPRISNITTTSTNNAKSTMDPVLVVVHELIDPPRIRSWSQDDGRAYRIKV